FALGLVTFVGAAAALIAFSPVRLPFRAALLAQAAGAFIALVAPAGVGPAALNLRLLTRRGVATSLAVATVALVQLSIFVMTVVVLLILSLFSDSSGALRSLPSSTVLGVLAILGVVVAVLMLIPALRAWVVAKVRPMVRNTWPRLVQVLS